MEGCGTLADEDDANELETPVSRPLVWLGNSLRNLRAFPAEAKKIIGDELQLIQFGGMPRDAKPFKGVGSGVLEIALRHDAEAYRTVLAVQLGTNNGVMSISFLRHHLIACSACGAVSRSSHA